MPEIVCTIVVNAATERPNNGAAFERFTPSGPLAVLPAGNGFLYAERVYLIAAGRAPVLRSVLAGYDGKVGFGPTTRAALADLAAGAWSRP